MKIAHEVPKCLLKESLIFNDYQFCLPFFYFRHKEYKQFFLDYRKKEDSFIILDSGLFEGETYTINELIALVNEIQPDIFIVPDEWNDSTKTHVNAKYWMGLKKSGILPEKTDVMVVLQGETFWEIKQLYRNCTDLGYNFYSFNHSSIAYESQESISPSTQRIELIQECVNENIIKRGHYIHLLGAIDINEFMYYDKYMKDIIHSIDTSSPILRGCHRQKYHLYNSQDKPEGKIEDFFDKDLDDQQRSCIFSNIKHFKKLTN